MDKKCCSHCRVLKLLSEFNKNKRQKDGYHYHCRGCKKVFAKNHYISHREKILKKDKFYRSNPIVKKRQNDFSRKWYRENKEYAAQMNKIYKQSPEIKEMYRVSNRKWVEKNKEKVKLYQREYRKTIKCRVCDKNKTYKRRGKMKFTDITTTWLKDLFLKTTHCELCNVELDNKGNKYPNGKQLDHILPLVAGGTHMKNNVRYICLKCNVSRPKDGSDIMRLAV
jgi:hypothetical protein